MISHHLDMQRLHASGAHVNAPMVIITDNNPLVHWGALGCIMVPMPTHLENPGRTSGKGELSAMQPPRCSDR